MLCSACVTPVIFQKKKNNSPEIYILEICIPEIGQGAKKKKKRSKGSAGSLEIRLMGKIDYRRRGPTKIRTSDPNSNAHP